MKGRSIQFVFIFIGVLIGIILVFQVRAQPVRIGSFPLDQFEVQKLLLDTFSGEQEQLQKKINETEVKLTEERNILEQRTSRQTSEMLNNLKSLTGFTSVSGEGIKIVLDDYPSVSRTDFSATNEHFVQASDLRDLINYLFLKDARAVSVNGKRVLPLTPIQPVFDSVLVGNFQLSSPFIVEAVGNPLGLEEATSILQNRKIQVYTDVQQNFTIPPREGSRNLKFLTLYEESAGNN